MKSNTQNFRRTVGLIATVVIIGTASSLRAASAVAVATNRNSGRLSYGYWKGDASESEAKARALNYCVNMGWANPKIIGSTSRRGYGAVVWFETADGKSHCAVSLGDRTVQQAISAALKKAKAEGGRYALVEATWHDGAGTSREDIIKL
jgi:hypothetical protein